MMRRRCAVFGCDNTDDLIQSHGFPENTEQAQKWKVSLKLDDFPIALMHSKFTVCRKHFRDSDYDEEGGTKLNETAVPTLNASEEEKECKVSVALMHSTTSTNNTDICVLETHESHYAAEDDNQLDHSIDAPDFTVLHAPQRHHSYAFDESTEVLLIHSENNDKSSHNAACSGTDSDVEVLMSEDVIDSDWSAGAAALEEFEQPDQQIASPASTTSLLVKRQGSATDQDISEEEFSHSSMARCDRSQLLSVIAEQATRIRQLEASLQRYRSAQQSLFDQVDALRLEFETSVSMEFNRSHETIN